MRHLSLLRHAKSSWDDRKLDDHERPLAPRGVKAARRMGKYLADHDLIPDHILCSDAVRARATLALVLPALASPIAPVSFSSDLYLTAPARILDVVREHAGGAAHVLVVGHNPGLHALALSLSGNGDRDDLARLAMKYPTAALAHFRFDVADWSDVRKAGGELERFVTPKLLD